MKELCRSDDEDNRGINTDQISKGQKKPCLYNIPVMSRQAMHEVSIDDSEKRETYAQPPPYL
jgi:hypothetical protein